MRVFLSYGHDPYSSLALRIKRDLELQGNEVWFDVEHLKTGGDWERYIDDGLNFASAIPDSGRFLILLTPHSVRRPDGYCLNELARAYSRNIPIIPVMVSTVEPPLSICQFQWLDMRNCFPAEQHEELYTKRLAQLVKALEEKQVPLEGVQQRLLNYLQPITYDDDLARHLPHFTGREWAMSEVNSWLASSKRVLWITGDAGVGKSALAAWLCDKRPEIAAYHFCRYGNTDRVDARRALFSLAYQLSTQFPVYQQRLNASQLDRTVVEGNLPTIFNRLFGNLLGDTVPLTHQPQVLLIDALDEASEVDRNGRKKNELASLLAKDLHSLPSWLRVIVTSRPREEEINYPLQALDPWKLDARREENLRDIRTYLRRELPPFTSNGTPSEQVVSSIVEKSEGLFLYVHWMLQELQEGRLSLSHVEKFPRGLGSVYADFFQRYFPNPHQYAAVCRPALELICAVREPLECHNLAELLCRSDYEMQSLLTELGSLFPVVDGHVRPFHQSVRDWLTDPARAGPYWIDVTAQEQRLAEQAWQEFKAGIRKMGRYCVTYAPSHFATCSRKSELVEVLLAPDWIQAKLSVAGVVPLLSDYDIALEVLQSKHSEPDCDAMDDNAAALVLMQGAIRLSSYVITEDPRQFGSQIVGRLLPYLNLPAIDGFVTRVARKAELPWLRPLHPALHSPGSAQVSVRKGHTGPVRAVAVTSEGRHVVSASDDGTLKVWDLGSGAELRTVTGSMGSVNAVAATPDGQHMISAFSDGRLKVWEWASGRELCTLIGHSNGVAAVAVTPDGQRAVSASSDKTLKVWELAAGRELRTLSGHTGAVRGVAVMPDGQHAVSASEDRTLKVWELATGLEVLTLTGHADAVWAVAVTPDGRCVVSASGDQTLKVWDWKGERELRTLAGHTNAVWAVAVTPDGEIAVSASWDKTLKVWELRNGCQRRALTGHTDLVNAVALTPEGRYAISASDDSSLKVWDLASGRELRTLGGRAHAVRAVATTPDGRQAVSVSDDSSSLKVWELASGRKVRTLIGHANVVRAVVATPDGRHVVSASSDGTLKVWELGTGCELRTLAGHSDWVSGVAVSGDGRLAVSASGDKTLKVWELASGRELRTLSGHTGAVRGVAVIPDGQHAVSASEDRTLKVWELSTGRELHTLSGHSDWVNAVRVTPDGQYAVSASGDRTLKVWELASGRELRTLSGHSDWVNAVLVTPDGQSAISVSYDGTLKVWALETGEVVHIFTCDSAALCCAFSDVLKLIVAGDAGGHVHVLHLEEPKPPLVQLNRPEVGT